MHACTHTQTTARITLMLPGQEEVRRRHPKIWSYCSKGNYLSYVEREREKEGGGELVVRMFIYVVKNTHMHKCMSTLTFFSITFKPILRKVLSLNLKLCDLPGGKWTSDAPALAIWHTLQMCATMPICYMCAGHHNTLSYGAASQAPQGNFKLSQTGIAWRLLLSWTVQSKM